MKTYKIAILSIIFIIAISANTYSQSFGEWSDPTPLTDSLSDNSNPFLYLDYDNGERLLMVWEKYDDSTACSIYFDDILDADPPQELLSSPGIHYTNPKIINPNYSGSDTSFFLLYESDINGNTDIFFKAYLTNGGFMEEVPLTTSPFDETQLTVTSGAEWWDQGAFLRNSVAYIRNDSLFVKNLMIETPYIYFGEETLIDAPFCSNPVLSAGPGNSQISYLKKDTVDNHIFQNYSDMYGNWGTPMIYYDSADCSNLGSKFYYGGNIWSAYIDTSWRILTKDYYGISISELSKSTPFDPAAMGFVIGVKNDWNEEIWVATPYPDNNVDEIYMTIWAGNPEFENFSNSGTDNRNPQFFHGEVYPYNFYCWYDYLVWESYRSGHWQIWASKVIQCAGNIEEEEVKEAFISIQPNPFTHETTIEFKLETRNDVIAAVYDYRGVYVASITNQTYDQGVHQLRWNGESLAAGVYIIQITVGDRVYTEKVVKSP